MKTALMPLWLHMLRSGLTVSLLVLFAVPAQAFCGFFVGKAETPLFNEASQVILTRKGNRTVISMTNDYHGDLSAFALVIPVPQVLQRGQINIGDPTLFARMDAYSSPRLAAYYDTDPCTPLMPRNRAATAKTRKKPVPATAQQADYPSVSVEAQYTVGEYDIVILSATDSKDLEQWLTSRGYHMPAGASRALKPYIVQNMKFFVARVNLKEQAKAGLARLRPLQFAFEHQHFMLPIRLGTINSRGVQNLIVYALTEKGRVTSSNYRTVKLPANVNLPTQVESNFARFYRAMFDHQAAKEKYKAVFTEYFQDIAWCDPCTAEALTPQELRQAGVWWLDDGSLRPDPQRPGAMQRRLVPTEGGQRRVMLTRLHMRYTPESFPEDLMLSETDDRQYFQALYTVHHPYAGKANCPEAQVYYRNLAKRQEKEAQTLASLSGWNIQSIRNRIRPAQEKPALKPKKNWWDSLWSDPDKH